MPTIKRKADRPPWMPPKNKLHQRAQPNRAIYNSARWRNLAKLHKQSFPLCAECERNDRISAVYATDHIVSIRLGGEPYKWDNLQSLCFDCHQTKGAREGRAKQLGRDSGEL